MTKNNINILDFIDCLRIHTNFMPHFALLLPPIINLYVPYYTYISQVFLFHVNSMPNKAVHIHRFYALSLSYWKRIGFNQCLQYAAEHVNHVKWMLSRYLAENVLSTSLKSISLLRKWCNVVDDLASRFQFVTDIFIWFCIYFLPNYRHRWNFNAFDICRVQLSLVRIHLTSKDSFPHYSCNILK